MPLAVRVQNAPVGITIPYGPERDERRCNHGFTDTRGRPELAAAIAEGIGSTEMRALLTALAAPDAAVFSVACDLGAYREAMAPAERCEVAGGYLQLMMARYAQADAAAYIRLAEHITAGLRRGVGTQVWDVTFLLKTVQFNLDGFGGNVPSLDIWFRAFAPKPRAALAARERLLRSLGMLLRPEAAGNAP
ncbi:hypothetical protein GCM10010909_35920 [Acidocella aquatica]|uniref:Uncharacterized protein n=1 Tax=Acidocella aquatica TaxID=1922313 RepID=A0ABQ6ABU6_9PROT|nr:hypothetical protein [Acidocella aquatica]GLR68910.1 hypothetical protein GCM10010909_35920 [Acidocella aquatica]